MPGSETTVLSDLIKLYLNNIFHSSPSEQFDTNIRIEIIYTPHLPSGLWLRKGERFSLCRTYEVFNEVCTSCSKDHISMGF